MSSASASAAASYPSFSSPNFILSDVLSFAQPLKSCDYTIPMTPRTSQYTFNGFQYKSHPINLSFEQIGLQLKNGSHVLEGISGKFEAGKLVAVMGPSGAGKTSFLEALSSRLQLELPAGSKKITGNVYTNGISAIQSRRLLNRSIGYVPQDDIIHGDLTVEENLYFSAMLRLPDDMPKSHKMRIVEDVIQLLGLDSIRHQIVGTVESRGISGGQRKRVNIGMELVSDPGILFMDEPTSGLDAAWSLDVLHGLRALASYGLTIIVVIHQPRSSIFQLFDDVLLLAEGGKECYLGATKNVLNYFERIGFICPVRENPADFLIDVISGVYERPGHTSFQPAQLADLWKQEQEKLRTIETEKYVSRSTNVSPEMNAEPTPLLKSTSRSVESSPLDLPRSLVKERGSNKPLNRDRISSVTEIGIGNNDLTECLLPPTFSSINGTWNEQDTVKSFSLNIHDPVSSISPSKSIRVRHQQLMEALPPLRITPSCWNQFQLLTYRFVLKLCRHRFQFLFDVIILLLMAVVIGLIERKHMDLEDYSQVCVLSLLAVGTLATVGSLRLFGNDRLIFQRERTSGISILAYFFSVIVVELHRVVLYPFFFTSVYYAIIQPHTSYFIVYFVFTLVHWCCSGNGLLLSVLFKPTNAILAATMIPIVLGGFLSGVNPTYAKMGIILRICSSLSFTRWSVEALAIQESHFEEYYGHENVIGYYRGIGYNRENFFLDISVLFLMGLLFRVATAHALQRSSRRHRGNKQKQSNK